MRIGTMITKLIGITTATGLNQDSVTTHRARLQESARLPCKNASEIDQCIEQQPSVREHHLWTCNLFNHLGCSLPEERKADGGVTVEGSMGAFINGNIPTTAFGTHIGRHPALENRQIRIYDKDLLVYSMSGNPENPYDIIAAHSFGTLLNTNFRFMNSITSCLGQTVLCMLFYTNSTTREGISNTDTITRIGSTLGIVQRGSHETSPFLLICNRTDNLGAAETLLRMPCKFYSNITSTAKKDLTPAIDATPPERNAPASENDGQNARRSASSRASSSWGLNTILSLLPLLGTRD